jgi:hypothetical protein
MHMHANAEMFVFVHAFVKFHVWAQPRGAFVLRLALPQRARRMHVFCFVVYPNIVRMLRCHRFQLQLTSECVLNAIGSIRRTLSGDVTFCTGLAS